MIGTEQWRASIGLYHSGSYQQLARIVGKRRRPPVTVYRLLWPLFSVLSLLVQTLFVVWTWGPYMLLVNGYSLFKGGLTRFMAFKKRTSVSQLLVCVCALSIAIMEDACANLERSLVARAILLIMSGDVEQNPGPIGQMDIQTVYKYLSTLSDVDLLTLGMELGLTLKTLRGYGKVSVPEYCYFLIGDWVNEKDNVAKCGGATWGSLVNALRSEEVSQNGIAAKIEAEQMGGNQKKQEGQKFLTKASEYLSTLSEVDLLTLGMQLGLSLKTLRGYGKVSVSKYCCSLLGDWVNEKDNVKECGGATWSSLVNALRSEEVSQNGIAAKIEAEQMESSQEKRTGDTPPQSVTHFADFLRGFYQTSKLAATDKWLPSPSKKYINLAAISREEVSTEEMKKFTHATLHGNIEDIVEIKAPIEIQALLDVTQGETLECVLVEGAPGVGKTTLAWEICRQWGKRQLFQHYSTVIQLQLRDETVQKAKSIKDLIFYNDESCKEEIAQYLKHIGGKDTLIILEGLDELPKHLLTQSSIFTSLLAGTELPQATILITSRPSATVQLWENWKHRMSRHIEVLGFTKEDIDDYIASVMSPKERPGFNDYLSLNPTIKLMMYIPIHTAIIIEVYRYCHKSSRLLPTSITELYTCLVQTILLRYLDTHPDYKHKKITLQKFTDLPPPVYHTFKQLMEMALQGVLNQQLTFPDQQKQIEHMGFMDTVTECIPHMRLFTYSYNFLHVSIQEYLGAYSLSLKTTEEQEQLLQRIHTERHLQNMGRFLAGITRFKDMDKATVKAIIEEDCETRETDGGTQLRLSSYTLQLINESGDWNIIAGYSSYYCQLTDYTPLLDFSNLGHSIVNGSYTWTLKLGASGQYMHSLERIDLLLNTLKKHSNPTYAIESIECCYDTPQCVERLLMELPQSALQQIRKLVLYGGDGNRQPLVFELILSMICRLNKLVLVDTAISDGEATAIAEMLQRNSTMTDLAISSNAISDSGATAIAEMLQRNSTLTHLNISSNAISDSGATAIAEMLQRNSTLTYLDISSNAISDSGATAIAEMLQRNSTLTGLYISSNAISDSGATAIAEMLQRNSTLTGLDISDNAISDSGATAIAEMLKHNNTLLGVYLSGNKFSAEGREALEKVEAIKKDLVLVY